MKHSLKLLFASMALAAITSPASAGLVINPVVATGVNPVASFDVGVAGFTATNGTIGTLTVDVGGAIKYTYLGTEAGDENIYLDAPGSTFDNKSTTVLATNTFNVFAGPLAFSFGTIGSSTDNASVANGSATLGDRPTFAIFSGGTSGYAYILGYEDKGGGGCTSSTCADSDWDDMVIGVNFAPAGGGPEIGPVPEPETYAMMMAGLGLMGLMVRRRKTS